MAYQYFKCHYQELIPAVCSIFSLLKKQEKGCRSHQG
jgi:hypothetical protein